MQNLNQKTNVVHVSKLFVVKELGHLAERYQSLADYLEREPSHKVATLAKVAENLAIATDKFQFMLLEQLSTLEMDVLITHSEREEAYV